MERSATGNCEVYLLATFQQNWAATKLGRAADVDVDLPRVSRSKTKMCPPGCNQLTVVRADNPWTG